MSRHSPLWITAFALPILILALFADRAGAETRNGTAGPDLLTGRAGASTINGRAGDDLIFGDPASGMGKPRTMERLSLTAKKVQGTSPSYSPSVTANGATLLFVSRSPQFFGTGQAGAQRQAFSKNLVTGAVSLVSIGENAMPFNNDVDAVAISPNGRYAAMITRATNIPGAAISPANHAQLVLKDLSTKSYTLISAATNGDAGSGDSAEPVFSPDSTKLAFKSAAGNLGGGDGNGVDDVFIVLLSKPMQVFHASTDVDGMVANGRSGRAVFSPDGTTLAFDSVATNLLAGPDLNNAESDVVLKALTEFDEIGQVVKGAVSLVSTTHLANLQLNTGGSTRPAFSPDGREVAFVTRALLAPDQNGADPDVYIKTIKAGGPRPTGTARVVSRSSTGAQGNGGTYESLTFSPDGTRLAFVTNSTNLYPGAIDTNQVVIKDLVPADGKGVVRLVSTNLASGGPQCNLGSRSPVFTAFGSRLIFASEASNLVGDDSNGVEDIFLATLGAPAAGKDSIAGGAGRDIIIGGRGADRLSGGPGADVFVYLDAADSRPGTRTRDTIADFNAGQGDVIDLRVIDANPRAVGNQAFTFIGARRFDGKRGRLRFSGGILSADINGNRKADFAVRVNVTGGRLTGNRILK